MIKKAYLFFLFYLKKSKTICGFNFCRQNVSTKTLFLHIITDKVLREVQIENSKGCCVKSKQFVDKKQYVAV